VSEGAVKVSAYHAHIYFDAATREAAAAVREEIAARFPVELGRWWDGPIGPHPEPMYQVAFQLDMFQQIVPWLMLNRRGLTILVHPRTGDERADHSIFPLWFGRVLPLRLAFFDELEAGTASIPPKDAHP